MQPLALAQPEELPALVLPPGGDEREQLLLRVVDDEEQPAHCCLFSVSTAAHGCGSSNKAALSKDALQGCFLAWQLDLQADLLLRAAAVVVAPRELALRSPDSELSRIRAPKH